MRVATNTDDRELSLEAMWHGYRASNFARQYRVEIDTGVVQALLYAIYFESSAFHRVPGELLLFRSWLVGLALNGVQTKN
jgi:hypothetical protein